ncbi:MAG: DUF177 domain-containing protein [Gemmatimonadales bacterium]
MLQVDVRELKRGPVATVGAVEPGDPLLEGLDLELIGPLEVRGTLEPTGGDDYFWRARLEGRVRQACRRCLTEVETPVATDVEVLFSTDEQLLDDPSVYPLPEIPTQVDLRVAIREELALAVPAYVVCREDCRGLCVRCGHDLNEGPCECRGPAEI